MKPNRVHRVYFYVLVVIFCSLPFELNAEEISSDNGLPRIGEVVPIPMTDDNQGNRTGIFTVDVKNFDVLLMVYSLSQQPGSYPIRLISEKGFSKKIKLPLYVKKTTIPTATAYAEYYFRRRSAYPSQFVESSESSPMSSPDTTRDFWVRRVEEPDKFVKVSADLKFHGQRCLIYRDKNIPDDFMPSDQIEEIGTRFDNEIYPSCRTHFGAESDINGDSRITIVITGMVSNHAAFFDQKDLFPDVPYSNKQETIFLRVPPYRVPTHFFTATLAHELQHLININQRVFLRHTYPEERWLDEGLSYLAEYLYGSQGTTTHAYTFLSSPQNYSLLYFTKPYGENQGTLGAVYLFMRYLVDRYGKSILPKLVQSEKRGIANVEAATGIDFPTLYRDWAAALFLSGTGLNPDPVFNYRSLNLRGLQAPIQIFRVPIRYFLNGPAERIINLHKEKLEKRPFESSVEAMGVQYLRLKAPETPVRLKLIGSPESRLEAAFIYLPKDFELAPQAPVETLEGILLDSPLPLVYPTKKKITISGKVIHPGVEKVGLRFEPQWDNLNQQALTLWSDVDAEGSFSFTFQFHPKQRGDFLIGVGLFTNPLEAPVKENIWVRVQ